VTSAYGSRGAPLQFVSRYFHTLRYLRSGQLLSRLRRKLYRPSPASPRPLPTRQLAHAYTPVIEAAPSMLAADTFRFLNVARRCTNAADWRNADTHALWIYNLHYFDDLNAVAATDRRLWHERLLDRWLAENPPAAGIGWDAYPTSRRIVNWIKFDLRSHGLPEACRSSLAVQARWLATRLEYDLLGNHLLANAAALVHAGLYFAGDEAQRWLRLGLDLLRRELAEQILPDGGHFERSTMYHAIVLGELLDNLNILTAYGESVPPEWSAIIARMRFWLNVMTHPDGGMAFFNDAAFAIAPTARELEAYAQRLDLEAAPDTAEPLHLLMPSGYVRLRAGPAWLACDCAPVGPDYQPGHAHADTLSFELSLGARRVFVNSGTSTYQRGPERDRQRGTAAHNTVTVDARDSSEVWSGFRVARRARVRLVGAHATVGQLTVEASHDGYRRLAGDNLHSRRWRLESTSLRIDDMVSGRFECCEARFHLHPDITAEIVTANEVVLRCGSEPVARLTFTDMAEVEVNAATWHPEFGLALANSCVTARFRGESLHTRIEWTQVACES
jgi:uncharacterized heparinase superfamily protein